MRELRRSHNVLWLGVRRRQRTQGIDFYLGICLFTSSGLLSAPVGSSSSLTSRLACSSRDSDLSGFLFSLLVWGLDSRTCSESELCLSGSGSALIRPVLPGDVRFRNLRVTSPGCPFTPSAWPARHPDFRGPESLPFNGFWNEPVGSGFRLDPTGPAAVVVEAGWLDVSGGLPTGRGTLENWQRMP